MSEEFESGLFTTLVDDNGEEFEVEILADMDYNGESYKAFLPADMDEDDPDYGMIILRCDFDENGDEVYDTVDDEELEQELFEKFSVLLFGDEDEE